jgi:ABC-type transport system involved in multi-copper enzyme maturation permease subunit
MIWLSWRQLRASAAVVYGALAVVAAVVAITGLQLHRAFTASGIAGCAGDACESIINAFLARDPFLQTLLSNVLLLLLPALIGVFWAAPLVARELDAGTYRLAWTQSVPRTRWLTAKLAVVGLAGLVATGVLSVLVTWWYGPIDEVNTNQFSPAVFGARDLVPVGYAAFAFALGVLAGVVTRRTLTAMAVTLVGYVGVRLSFAFWARPHLLAPLTSVQPLEDPTGTPQMLGGGPGAASGKWILSQTVTDPSGAVTDTIRINSDDPCMATRTCLSGYHVRTVYQPAGRYWTFQWLETGIFVALAVALIGLAYWWLRRRLS